MRKKFIQRQETRYVNNEFCNMPSVDYGTWRSERLCAKNKNRIDLDKAKAICAKYGFGCTYINSTFCGDDADFVVYFKTNIDADEYRRLEDSAYGKDHNRDDAQKLLDMWKEHIDTFIQLHKCIHELDEQTYLMFECGWAGNCGLFGSDDVRRMTYSFGSNLHSWRDILNCWDGSIHDTHYQLSKGVYALMSTRYIKPQLQDSPELDDAMEQTLLDIVRKELSNEYVANFETGKRQCDSESYKALVVRYKSDNSYCSMIRFSRDWMGRYTILTARPLCGESSWIMNWRFPTDDIVSALGDCSIYAE